MQSEALGCGSQAGYRGQVDLRPEETTDRLVEKLVCQSLHTPDQSRTGIAWDLRMAKGDFLHQGTHCLAYNISNSVVAFSTNSYKRNRAHIVLTFD